MRRIETCGACVAAALAVCLLVVAPASASAAITFKGKSFTAYGEREKACKIARPSGVASGNEMLVQVYAEDPSGAGPFTISASGWTLVEKVENKSYGIWFQLAVFAKRYEASDPAEYSFSWTGTSRRGCGALGAAWSGVSASEPINAHLGAPSFGASTTVRGPSITTTKASSMVVMLGDYNGVDTRTAPPGMEDIAGPEGVIAQALQSEAGASGNKDAKTTKGHANVGVTVALSPE